jgi:hypothetical protein
MEQTMNVGIRRFRLLVVLFLLPINLSFQSLAGIKEPKRDLGNLCRTNSNCSYQLTRRRRSQLVIFAKKANKRDVTNSNMDIINSVSEGEAVLACRAYLKKHARLEWTQRNERRRLQEAPSDEPGFFWGDTKQLKYFTMDRSKWLVNGGAGAGGGDKMDISKESNLDDVDPQDGKEIWATVHPQTILQGVDLYKDQEEDDAELSSIDNNYFVGFDESPSPSRIRRSQAARKIWSDPEFYKRWYQQRWGRSSILHTQKRRRHKVLEERVRALKPDSFLALPQVGAMTEYEIADAIRTYVQSRARQSTAHKAAGTRRNAETISPPFFAHTNETRLPGDFLFRVDPAAMERARQERSDRATRLYQKRRDNQGTMTAPKITIKQAKSSTSHTFVTLSPRDALGRIQVALDAGVLPCVKDVECILKPSKLSRRKDTLRRILSDGFDLRGKCVPVDEDMVFVTTCTIDHLGAFVLQKLREASR